MIKKSLTKLVGLKKADFDFFIESKQIQVQPARLIPTLKTGDEMALSSIFLTALSLVKEYRDNIFKELKLSRSGKPYYYTEACFPDMSKSRVDGLIIIVSKGIITDAVFFEMKNKNNSLSKEQIETYIDLSRKLKIGKLVTISNEFVADSSHSPLKIKTPKSITLFHFSWTYLITKGQLLLFKNEHNIKDIDQVEIMREVLYYFGNPVSGISGYTQMKPGLPFIGGAIWLAIYSSKQRSQNKRLQQEYAFKEDVAKIYYGLKQEIEELGGSELGVKLNTKMLETIISVVEDNPSKTLDNSSHNDKGPILSSIKSVAELVKNIKNPT